MGVILGAIYGPIVGTAAFGSVSGVLGIATLLTSTACAPVIDLNLQSALNQINAGLH